MNILFICTANQQRSLTAELLCTGRPGLEVRSAGTMNGARVEITADLITWADRIYVMEEHHKAELAQRFPLQIKDRYLKVLYIEDRYDLMEPALIELLAERLRPELPHGIL